MPSEARRGILRMASNYARLFTTVCLGLVLARLILGGLGNDAWALISLLGSTVGIAAMLQDIVRASMVRELGEAYHTGDDALFLGVYNSALVLTAAVAGLSFLLICSATLLVPLLEIPEGLRSAARWMIVAKAFESATLVILAAPFNMYRVKERIGVYNLWLILMRSAPTASAFVLFVLLGLDDPARGITLYALISSGVFVAFQVSAALGIMAGDRRLVPAPRLVTSAGIRSIARIGGWNTAVVTALNLHIRADNVIMNLFFGLWGNLIFGLTAQLTGYVRMLTTGATFGVDAVSVRLSKEGGTPGVQRLCHHSTRIHGMVAFPAAVGLFVLAEPILGAWLRDRIQDWDGTAPYTVVLIRVVTVGMVCRAIVDGWTAILYGAGHVSRYAPLILVGGLANPVLAVLLILVLPEPVRYIGAGLAFSAVFLLVYVAFLPRKAASLLEMRVIDLYRPLLRPLAVTLISAPVLLVAAWTVQTWTLLTLAGVSIAYGIVYAVLTALFVLKGSERRRAFRTVGRLLGLRRE